MLDFIKIFIIVSITAMCFATQSFAATLDSVQIKKQGETFDVVLNSKDNIKMKTKVLPDKMVLTLKDTQPSEKFFMQYDTHIVDNMVVKPNNNDTLIFIQSDKVKAPVKNNKYILFTFLGLILLVSQYRKPKQKIAVRIRKHHNLDYILKNKVQKENKIKIAA
jgi:hypothetical protein